MKPITELDKPSVMTQSSLFAHVNIAVADSDHKVAVLIKKILFGLGCNRIFLTRDGQELLDLMKEEQVDIVITEWDMKIMGGLELATHLRQSLDSPNRMIPILMLTGRNDTQAIRTARDAGISEYLTKPFSAKALLERVHTIVEDPRSFIICKNYIGPDRRRISSLTLPPDPDQNREYFERKPAVVVPREQLKQLILDDTPRMIMPDYTLKQKLGFHIAPELINNPLGAGQSEEEITKAQQQFMASVQKDIAMLEASYQELVKAPEQTKKHIASIQEAAFSIKSRAGIFGYLRATEVAAQLHNFCRSYYDRENKYHLIILEKHIQTIAAIFASNIKGDGGEVGKELMKDLARLINKYLQRKD